MIKNSDNLFFRMVGVALCRTFNKRLMYINRFENAKIRVMLPTFLSLPGDANFIFDAFVDDIVDKRVDGNYDQLQRGVLEFTSIDTISNELANPNQYISKKCVVNDKVAEIISKVKAVKVELAYNFTIYLDNEIDIIKISEKMLNTYFNYMFFNIDYYGIKIDAFFSLPDSKTIDYKRDIGFVDGSNSTRKSITFQVKVETFYPIFQVDADEFEVCDNDDDIPWDFLGIRRPDLNTDPKLIKRVYWDNLIYLNNHSGEKEIPYKYQYITLISEGKSKTEILDYYDTKIADTKSVMMINFYRDEIENFNTLLKNIKNIK